jgi:CrcB protein
MLTLVVALAAGVGALCRYVADALVQAHWPSSLPWGTIAVNITGSFLAGLFAGLAMHHGLGGHATAVLASGFAGGYTTLSTWAWETVALQRGGATSGAVLNLSTLLIGLGAAVAGLSLALV